jgi:hypothetical protein
MAIRAQAAIPHGCRQTSVLGSIQTSPGTYWGVYIREGAELNGAARFLVALGVVGSRFGTRCLQVKLLPQTHTLPSHHASSTPQQAAEGPLPS